MKMRIQAYFYIFSILLFVTGCVSSKTYNNALDEIARMKYDSANAADQVATMESVMSGKIAELQRRTRAMTEQLDSLNAYSNRQKLKIDRLTAGLTEAIPDFQHSGIETQFDAGLMYIRLPGRVLFNFGEDRLTNDGLAVITQIAGNLKTIDSDLMILGHTDSIPYNSSTGDNWILSINRAHSVMEALVKNGVPAERIIVAGRGKYDRFIENDHQIGRLLNRRIEIVLLPDMEVLQQLIDSYTNQFTQMETGR